MTLATPLLIYNLQSAFRTGHSTETALIRLTDEILLNMDKDEVTGLVFIDFRKAFDTVDHKLLLRKLPIYGASDAAVSWIKSYLSNRKQFVKLGNQSSELLAISRVYFRVWFLDRYFSCCLWMICLWIFLNLLWIFMLMTLPYLRAQIGTKFLNFKKHSWKIYRKLRNGREQIVCI